VDEVSRVQAAMKTLLFILSLSLLADDAWGQSLQPQRTDKEMLKVVSQNMGISVDSMEFFQTAPAQTAWKTYLFLRYRIRDGEKLAKKAGLSIAENPGVEKYVTDGLAKLPHAVSTSSERSVLLAPLGDVPAPWSLRLLGRYLMDDRPLKEDGGFDDTGATFNPSLAARTLERMDFSDAPDKGPNGEKHPAELEAWRAWWKKNEPIAEQRIAEINPGYYKPTPIPAPLSPAPTPIVIGEYAATPANTPKPAATPKASPTPAPSSSPAESVIYIIGGLLALGALGAVAWAMRKQK
jgi:hypothetical protein